MVFTTSLVRIQPPLPLWHFRLKVRTRDFQSRNVGFETHKCHHIWWRWCKMLAWGAVTTYVRVQNSFSTPLYRQICKRSKRAHCKCVPYRTVGSAPTFPTNMVLSTSGLSRRPFKAESRVRIPLASPIIWHFGQAVKTLPFHGSNTGSNPVSVTMWV